MSENTATEGLKVRGFFRINIVNNEDGSIAGDSGWVENQIQDLGYNKYLAGALMNWAASSLNVGYVALGTGTLNASADATLHGEITGSTKRQAVTTATSSNSKAAVFTATFATSNSFLTGAGSTLANIGLFNSSTAGTMFACNTYTGSACASNQAVNVTYQINFT
jgi:hypothetical protein